MVVDDTNQSFRLNIRTLEHLRLRINFPLQKLEYFAKEKEKYVKQLPLVQFKNGKRKERTVYNPSPTYKKLLRNINRNLLATAPLPIGVLGGVVGKSIDDMAKIHCGKECTFSIDMKDFFPSIKSGRIFNLFISAGCTHKISEVLTNLVTLNGSLPQGYPTSPMLANLVAVELDSQHLQISEQFNLSRTRWIDDIVFSGRTKDIKSAIKSIIGAVKNNGFKTSHKKTDFSHRSENPIVLGLIVSKDKPQIPIAVISKVKDILLECKENGIEAVQANYDLDPFGRRKNLSHSLRGRIRRIEQYNKIAGSELWDIFHEVFGK